MPYTLAISRCPNDIYLFAGILCDQVTPQNTYAITLSTIDLLNQMPLEVDFCKISAAAYPRYEAATLILPLGKTEARGRGPKLVAAGQPPSDLSKAVFLVPGLDTSASGALRVLFPDAPQRAVNLNQIVDETIRNPGSIGVIINESQHSENSALSSIGDLGNMYRAATGHGLVLGVYVAKRSLPAAVVETFLKDAATSLAWSQANHACALAITMDYAQESNPEAVLAHIQEYVR